MVDEKNISAIKKLIEYWRKQSIAILPESRPKIENIEKIASITLPNDFKDFYEIVNGMSSLYPNDCDDEGFLFYPVEKIRTAKTEFQNSDILNVEKIFLFADYMHRSWWYGFEILKNNDYTIGIIPDKSKFKPITNSLSEFIEFYIADSPKLYDYS